ncbi:metal ABC transporter substrate-binding protein [Guyparkeria sp.]|uniref:metal ABC transporter substrate-binding protein n=1 Tax=Guyparkeria sp. TaxID=2035736 RepID=UPI0035691E6E
MQKFIDRWCSRGSALVRNWRRMLPVLVLAGVASVGVQAQDEVLRYGSEKEIEPLTVVTDTTISADLVENIAGSFVEVETVLERGESPIGHELDEADRESIAEADLVVYQGLGLMPAFIEAAEARDETDRVVLSAGIPDFRLIREDGTVNPHTYHSPSLVQFAVDHLTVNLKKKLEPVAGEIEGNRLRINIELQSLMRETEGLMEELPRNERILVTDNDVFAYFAKDYHFQLLDVTREEDADEAIELIEQNETANVFRVDGAGDGAIEEWLEAHRGEDVPGSVELAPALTGLWLGDANRPTGTYIGMFRQNVNDIMLGLRPLPAAGEGEIE